MSLLAARVEKSVFHRLLKRKNFLSFLSKCLFHSRHVTRNSQCTHQLQAFANLRGLTINSQDTNGRLLQETAKMASQIPSKTLKVKRSSPKQTRSHLTGMAPMPQTIFTLTVYKIYSQANVNSLQLSQNVYCIQA